MTSSAPGAALPVDASLPELLGVLGKRNVAVLTAPPGAGKTTRVPAALLGEAWCTGRVLALEPRRLAARAAAAFVARQRGEAPGRTIGYRVRLETRVSAATRVEFVTEGVFTRMALADPELGGISAVIFDEFHERSLDTDLGLALALDIQAGLRPDLRILVMSATLEIDRLSRFLGGAPVIESHGRSFPIEVRYEARSADETIERATARAVLSALAAESGSVLAFLPGQAEIRRAIEHLAGRLPAGVSVHPLHGGIDPGEQEAAIRPAAPGTRKVVLATAIAETSLTIEGVRVVVDSGLARVPRYEPRTGLTRLETVRASHFSVDQRAGRAGRTGSGIAIRLWREQQNAALAPAARPEILEADLSPLALDLAGWGVTDPAALRWLDPPPAPAWTEAVALLKELGALDRSGAITPAGKAMRQLPLAPRFAHMVVAAADHGQAREAALLALIASERGLGGKAVDLALRLDRLRHDRGERAAAARRLAARMVRDLPEAAPAGLSAGALLSLAWPDRMAQLRGAGRGFRLANGRGAIIDEVEPLAREAFVVVADLQGAAASARILSAAAVTAGEIERLHGARFTRTREVGFDEASGAVRARHTRRLGTLVMSAVPVEPTFDEAGAVLAEAVRRKGLAALGWDKAATRLRDRIAFLNRHVGGWPDASEAALLARLEDWLLPVAPAARSLADLGPRSLMAGLDQLLALHGRSRRELDAALPETFLTPAGSRIALRYEDDQVVLPVRVQELYGMTVHPAIADGSIALTLELLSPAGRPIQVTRDLPRFWAGSWAAVRAEMRGRYPRHFWPEDPAGAPATTRVRPR